MHQHAIWLARLRRVRLRARGGRGDTGATAQSVVDEGVAPREPLDQIFVLDVSHRYVQMAVALQERRVVGQGPVDHGDNVRDAAVGQGLGAAERRKAGAHRSVGPLGGGIGHGVVATRPRRRRVRRRGAKYRRGRLTLQCRDCGRAPGPGWERHSLWSRHAPARRGGNAG